MRQTGAADFAASKIRVKPVQNADEFAMVLALRGAIFLAEEDNITYFDEFSGNDYAATHLLAFVDGDPAGLVRVRWFAEFALIERIGIRRRYRSYAVLSALARAALDLCRQKGYRTVAGRARLDIVNFWKRFGGRQSGPAHHMFRGTLVPIVHDLAPRPGLAEVPPGPFGDPAFEDLIAQQEGGWDFTNMPAQPQPMAAE